MPPPEPIIALRAMMANSCWSIGNVFTKSFHNIPDLLADSHLKYMGVAA